MMPTVSSVTTFIVLTFLFMLLPSFISGVEIKNIDVPLLKLVGEDVELKCQYDLDSSHLYSVKWWRNNEQFFQYIPANDHPMMTFNVSGINVDENWSSADRVTLRTVDLNTTGNFTCEVIADTSFETKRKSAEMVVVDPPDGIEPNSLGPVIKVVNYGYVRNSAIKYKPGTLFEATCLAIRSSPIATLQWFINNEQSLPKYIVGQTANGDGHAYTTTITVRFQVAGNHFGDDGFMNLTCVASVGKFYRAPAHVILYNAVLRSAQLSGYFGAGPILRSSTFVVLVVQLVYHSWPIV